MEQEAGVGGASESPPRVLVLHRTVMKTQFQREIKHTGRRGWIQRCARSERTRKQGNVHSNSREPSRRGTEVKELEPGEPGGAREAGK